MMNDGKRDWFLVALVAVVAAFCAFMIGSAMGEAKGKEAVRAADAATAPDPTLEQIADQVSVMRARATEIEVQLQRVADALTIHAKRDEEARKALDILARRAGTIEQAIVLKHPEFDAAKQKEREAAEKAEANE